MSDNSSSGAHDGTSRLDDWPPVYRPIGRADMIGGCLRRAMGEEAEARDIPKDLAGLLEDLG